MTWKHQRTSHSAEVTATVDLDEFSELQLLQGLIDAKWITEDEAEGIEKRYSTKGAKSQFASNLDLELMEAQDQLRRGNRAEAIIHLERFLGRDWIGALQ